jgi:serine/threonine protein kinase
LTEQQCLAQFRQLASAVRHLHEKRLVHRDIKLENILIDRSGFIKLCDFSFLGFVDQVAGEFVGTPNYLAPELWDERSYSFPVDIWSLGCVFYEILTGRHPFPAQGTLRLMRLVREDPTPPIDRKYSTNIQQLVYDMLTKEPSRRPTIGAVCDRIDKLERMTQVSRLATGRIATGSGKGRNSPEQVVVGHSDSADVEWDVRTAPEAEPERPRIRIQDRF